MNRTGKIARLPHEVREELNRRLRDNVSGPKICEWVNRLPAARAVCAEFAKRNGKPESPINENQLSEWRRGGFQDWLREQQVLDETREMARWSMQLARDGGGDLSEGAAVLLSGQVLKVLQGLAAMAGSASGHGSDGGQSNIEPPKDHSPEPCVPPHPGPLLHFAGEREKPFKRSQEMASADGSEGVSPTGSCTGTVRKLAGGDARATGNAAVNGPENSESGLQGELLRVADPRSGVKRVESRVRVLGALGRCLSGIRRGDQNRARLAQVDRKLAQRDEMIALERRKYDDERAEIRARKKAEEKKKKAERKKNRRLAGLSDCGQIDWRRGQLFGGERVIKEKEAEIKESQKDLAILKREFGASEDCSDGGSQVESKGGSTAGDQSPKSNVVSTPGAVASSGAAEHTRIIPSNSEQLQKKIGSKGGQEVDFSTQRRKEAEAQGVGIKN